MDRQTATYGNRSQAFLRVEDSARVSFSGPGGYPIGIARLRSREGGVGMSDPHLSEDAFMINVQMIDYAGDIFLNGRKLAFQRQPTGHAGFFDYRRNWRANLHSAFACVNFHVDRRAFGVALMNGERGEVESLDAAPGEPVDDRQLYRLAQAMWPIFDRPIEPSRLFMEQVGWALCAHVAQRYGIKDRTSRQSRSGLALWQERRAKELIEASLDGDLSVEMLAEECGLSVAHFARSFKQSVGMPPYRWLLSRRVEKAKDMLRDETLSVSQIAVGCGFADQSHMSRVFRKFTGIPPSAWRRLHVDGPWHDDTHEIHALLPQEL